MAAPKTHDEIYALLLQVQTEAHAAAIAAQAAVQKAADLDVLIRQFVKAVHSGP